MKITTVLMQVLAVGLVSVSQASAATYEYAFQENVVEFPFSTTDNSQISTERLSAPYLNMTVKDTADGIDVSIRINESFLGWLDSIYFDYTPALSQGSVVRYRRNSASSTPPSQPYFYSTPDDINGIGTVYSISDWRPTSTILAFSYAYPVGDSLIVHFRNLPEEISAADFTPQYLAVQDTLWGKAGDRYAYVLASPVAAVPEPSTAGLLCAGIALIGWSTRKSFSGITRKS
jgi:hypothetical protein